VKLVFSLAMFYDLDDPIEFAKNVRSMIADDGLWVLEVADADIMLQDTVYDGICHEHVTYWDQDQLHWCVAQAGFMVYHQERTTTNGGSLLLFCRPVDAIVRVQIVSNSLQHWMQFASRVDDHRRWFDRLVWEAGTERHRKVYGLGASTKGNVLLWQLSGYNDQLLAIGEVKPDKIGRETPVGRIPIISQDEALEQADDLIVFPWHFRPFFEETIRPRLRPGQRLIYPLPF